MIGIITLLLHIEMVAFASSCRGSGAVAVCIQEVVSPDMMIPEGRLQSLVEQALDRQLERCLFHNVRKPMVSLLSDYQCGREQIPSVVCQVSFLLY